MSVLFCQNMNERWIVLMALIIFAIIQAGICFQLIDQVEEMIMTIFHIGFEMLVFIVLGLLIFNTHQRCLSDLYENAIKEFNKALQVNLL